MLKNLKKIIGFIFYELISALYITFSVVPAFNKIGHFFVQIGYTVIVVLIFLFIADDRKIKPTTVSHSLIIMLIYWLGQAVITQIILHQKSGDKSLHWIYSFYYDKPALILVVFATVIMFYTLKFILNNKNSTFVKEYSKFQKTTVKSFIFYYFSVLVYCFVLSRGTNNHIDLDGINLVPFTIIKNLIETNFYYEYVFFFFGNILIFMPLGVLIPAITKNKAKPFLYFFPFVVSIGIEVSQLLLGNGHPEIDDVILNASGYFIGYLLKIFADRIINKKSNGKYKSIFIF